ncbi:piezo-type mechanosensitive ion channel component-like [Ixodes scapularis]
MVSSIGIRLDAFALFTSLWLCGMFLLRRCYLAKVWAFYVAYLCFVLPLQYAMVMGIPPGLCTEYPWWNPSKKTLRETALWFFLPDFQEPPLAWKLWRPERGTNANTEDGVCRVPLDEAGLLWDGICLTFLLVQKRLFTSYYFHHLIIEILAQQQLASRGAELINEMQVKGVQEQRAADKEIMEKIKRKMDKIRAAQQRVRGHEYGEPQTHFQALRSGDYYFFEDFADMDIDLEVETKKQKTDEEDADVKFRGLNALLTNAMRTRTIKGAQETARRGSQEFTEDYGELDATPLSTSHPAPTQISDTAVISSVEASTSGAVPSSNELFQAAPQVHPATETPTERTEQRNTEDEFLLASEAKRTLPNEDTLTDKVDKLLYCFFLTSTKGPEPSLDVISKLKYLHGVVSESLRMFPPGARLERCAASDYVLGETGIQVPKGCVVAIPVYAMHHDPENFPDPETFDPNRFSEENVDSIRPYTYLPFGAGPRNCIGRRFALEAVKLSLLHSVHSVEFVRTKNTKVPLEFVVGFGVFNAKNITVGIRKRTT